MRDFKKYKVWEFSHQLTLDVYRITLVFPDSEKFGLISQLRRAAYSIPSNFAEGSGKESDKSLIVFYKCVLVQLMNWNIL